MMELRDRLRSGDIWVEGSRAFRAFDDFLLPPETFAARRREDELGLAVPDRFDTWRAERVDLLRCPAPRDRCTRRRRQARRSGHHRGRAFDQPDPQG